MNDEWPMEIVHEMGHFVNDYLNMYSSLPENKVLFYNESDKISIYAETNDREFLLKHSGYILWNQYYCSQYHLVFI